ncbi:hypothetical protein [Desulfonema magnum]|uniref:Uncharacterized protein n=1 Tax=Desulfonema magnum TaxID=45655 RepID=A0A975BIV6_9BACT|nr:hypothetical protein [Desulfonema magnum]QTA86153.1 Uncharacterized protein dnm_021740 [Desulfonema magnum]
MKNKADWTMEILKSLRNLPFVWDLEIIKPPDDVEADLGVIKCGVCRRYRSDIRLQVLGALHLLKAVASAFSVQIRRKNFWQRAAEENKNIPAVARVGGK